MIRPAFTALVTVVPFVALAQSAHTTASPGTAPGAPFAGANAKDLEDRAADVRGCLQKSIEAIGIEYNAAHESFLYDVLSEKHEAFARTGPLEFCAAEVMPLYWSGRAEAIAERRKNPAEAPPGTDAIESDAAFVKFVQNRTGRHTLGHSDITKRACEILEVKPSDDFCLLLRAASQSPDFFHWYEDVYHAQTVEDGPGTQKEREAASIEAFVKHTRALLGSVEPDARKGLVGRAIFNLGVALHGIQDLIFHRGLTLRQHAGLSYYRKANPDLPPDDAHEDARIETAAVESARLIAAIREKHGNLWVKMATWKQPAGWKYLDKAKEFTGRKEDIGVIGLARYWALSLPYRLGRSAAELSEDQRAKWEVNDVVKAVHAP